MSVRKEPRSFGVEEEYLLLDHLTGMPKNRAEQMIRETREHEPEQEFLLSQLETATPICRTGAEALLSLRDFRRKVASVAAEQHLVLAGTGLPPIGGDVAGMVTPKERYRAIATELRGAAAVQYMTGTHVHVEIPSRDMGVEVLARLARWAPALLAITANSPIWCGDDTGFASWRHPISVAWPLRGYPPEFIDGADYTSAVTQLVESGVLLDSGVVTWAARLAENYPTIELRIADAQLFPEDAVAFALLVRALVERAIQDTQGGVARARYTPGLVNGAIWMAARDGLAGNLIDPLSGRGVPAFELIGEMVGSVQEELDRFGDTQQIAEYTARLMRDGGPARLQRTQFETAGVEGLLSLYRAGSEAPTPALG